jgi:CheY-like chemotaxis protein
VNDRVLFEQHVKEALNRLYSTAALQQHPLLGDLGIDASESDAVATLRQTLRDAIDTLKPAIELPFSAPEWMDHRLLWTRYISARSQSDTCAELNISCSTYYRHHADALSAVVAYLWCRHEAAQRTNHAPQASPAMPDRLTVETTNVVKASQCQPIDVARFLREAAGTIHPLLEQERLTLHVQTDEILPTLYADPSLLTQVVMVLLTEACGLAEGRALALTVTAEVGHLVWRIGPLAAEAVAALGGASSMRLAVPRALIASYGGQLGLEEEASGAAAWRFTLPSGSQRRLLVIDDDPDVTRLYRIYLQSLKLSVIGIESRNHLHEELAHGLPAAILLDILMPGWDGWTILRELRANPDTTYTPVIVCSVLPDPRLALALGANTVLQKPVSADRLVAAVSQLPES